MYGRLLHIVIQIHEQVVGIQIEKGHNAMNLTPCSKFLHTAVYYQWWWGPNINAYMQKGHHSANLTHIVNLSS